MGAASDFWFCQCSALAAFHEPACGGASSGSPSAMAALLEAAGGTLALAIAEGEGEAWGILMGLVKVRASLRAGVKVLALGVVDMAPEQSDSWKTYPSPFRRGGAVKLWVGGGVYIYESVSRSETRANYYGMA